MSVICFEDPHRWDSIIDWAKSLNVTGLTERDWKFLHHFWPLLKNNKPIIISEVFIALPHHLRSWPRMLHDEPFLAW